MNNCSGLMGKLFGHKFRPRMESECGEGKWPFTEGSLESQMSVASTSCEGKAVIMEQTRSHKTTYLYDICVRCGEKIERNA